MTDTTTLRLRGKDIIVDASMRSNILEEMPEIGWISSEDLRRKVLDAWSAAVASAGLSRIGDMKPSGNYDTKPLRNGTQADHIRSVARLAVKIAAEMDELFPDFIYDRDLLIAGSLCHDIGKVWEFDPENIARWKADPGKTGYPSLRHPGYGIHICLTADLPEEVAHMAAGHSAEGELLTRSRENTILRWADHTFWQVAEAANLLSERDTWVAPAQKKR